MESSNFILLLGSMFLLTLIQILLAIVIALCK